MEPNPLAPKPEDKSNHDVSHILREAFQDVLGEETFPMNVSSNIQKGKQANSYINKVAYNARYALFKQHNHYVSYDDIEEKMMYNKSHQLICQEFIDSDPLLKERAKLNSIKLLPNVEARDALHYGLLSINDVEFTPAEIAIDTRLQIINRQQDDEPCTGSDRICDEEVSMKVDEVKTDSAKSANKAQKIVSRASTRDCETLSEESGFKIIPEKLVFYDYKLGRKYKKKLTLKNVLDSSNKFSVFTDPSSGYFRVDAAGNCSRIAPGMTATVIVEFLTDTFLDVFDVVQFRSEMGVIFEADLIAYRDAPYLKICIVPHNTEDSERKYCRISDNFDMSRSIALNYTIDCGFCFLGSCIEMDLLICNEGGAGEFFVMTEEEWYNKEITNIDKEMALSVGGFKLHPSFFKLEENKHTSLKVEFRPETFGLHLETLHVLCNNNSLEKIEIIGDGVYYEKWLVKVEGQIMANKTCSQESDITHNLYLGNRLPHCRKTNSFTINNDSSVDLTYEIKWRPEKHERHCGIKADWVDFDPNGSLQAYSENEVDLSICCRSYEEGFYSGVLMIIVKDVPRVCLEPDKCFDLVQREGPNDQDLVDVVAARMQISCDLVPFQVKIVPNIYTHPHPLSFEEAVQEAISVKSSNDMPVKCKWVFNEEVNLKMSPEEFTLEPYGELKCDFKIHAHDYEDVVADIELSLESGLHKELFSVFALSEKPICLLSEFRFHLGSIGVNKQVEKEMYVENLSQVRLSWLILEIAYDVTKKRFMQVHGRVKPSTGELEGYKDRSYFNYEIRTEKPILWSSTLLLMMEHKKSITISDLSFANYRVVYPEVQIKTDKSSLPILFSDRILHKHFPTVHRVYVRNVGKIRARFRWGEPVGSQHEDLLLKLEPRSGTVEPGQCVHVDVQITPLALGVIENVLVPCFVDSFDDAIMLRILCLVDDIYFTVHLPDCEDIYWPPAMINDYDAHCQTYELQDGEDVQDPSINTINAATSLYDMPILSARSSCSCSSAPNHRRTDLSDYIDPQLVLQDHILQFENVPLRTVVKKRFFITNLTPLDGAVTCQATYFFARTFPEEKCVFRRALQRAGKIKGNEFDDYMNEEGFVIIISPETTHIQPHEKVAIDIYVYAHTWGVYCDELTIEVNDCLPFSFNVICKVVGTPIKFPFAANTINSVPTCRFDTTSHNMPLVRRQVKVQNTSSVPITVIWHIFVKEEEDSEEFPTRQYFNVIFDMFDPKKFFEVINGQLLLTDNFYGWCDDRVFKTSPDEMCLGPYETKILDVEFKANELPYEDCLDVVAYAVGTVYLPYSFINKAYLYRRWSDEELDFVKLQLTGRLVKPDLELLSGKSRFSANACQLPLKGGCKEIETTLTLKNSSKCPIMAKMFVKHPFEIKEISSKLGRYDPTTDLIQPNDFLNVNILLRIDSQEVLEMSEMFYDKDNREEHYGVKDMKNMCLTVKKDLVIALNSMLEMTIPLTLDVYFPKIEVDSETIDFGITYLGQISKVQLILKNRSRQDIPITVTSTSTELTICPTRGVLKKNTGVHPQYMAITVYFKPAEAYEFHEVVRISTNIPKLHVDIPASGSGTQNQYYMK